MRHKRIRLEFPGYGIHPNLEIVACGAAVKSMPAEGSYLPLAPDPDYILVLTIDLKWGHGQANRVQTVVALTGQKRVILTPQRHALIGDDSGKSTRQIKTHDG